MPMTVFKPFRLETNMYFAVITTLEEWKEGIESWMREERDDAREKMPLSIMALAHADKKTATAEKNKTSRPQDYMPEFGTYPEHTEKLTLEVWAKENDMYKMLSQA